MWGDFLPKTNDSKGSTINFVRANRTDGPVGPMHAHDDHGGCMRETETYSWVSRRNQGLIPSAPSEKMRVRNRLASTATEMSGRLML